MEPVHSHAVGRQMRGVAIEAPLATPLIAGGAVVIDTNIVLDLFVFDDAAAKPLRQALERAELQWVATVAMRDELARVLDYPQIVPRLAFYKLAAADVLARFDANARLAPVPPKAAPTCKDADDQKFIDLAVAYQAILLSKDRAVLSMKKRLAALSVNACAALMAQSEKRSARAIDQ